MFQLDVVHRPDLSGLGWVAAAAVRSFGKQCLSCRPCSSTPSRKPQVWSVAWTRLFPVDVILRKPAKLYPPVEVSWEPGNHWEEM